MIEIAYPILVEGKYDRERLLQSVSANVITTDGFGIFKRGEKLALLRALTKKNRLIVLTDSDGAGKVIRNFVNSALPRDSLIHLYIPQIEGTERRKSKPSKSGFLGVEGMDAERLRRLLEPFSKENTAAGGEHTSAGNSRRVITKNDFYEYGFSGGSNSAALRDRLAARFDLPAGMSANSLLAALNIICGYEDYLRECVRITDGQAVSAGAAD